MSDFALPGANALLNGDPLPSTLYVQGHLGNPGSNGTANVAAETDRIAINSWTTSTTGSIANDQVEELLNASATESWTHVTYWDAPTGGVCWFVDDIANISITAADTIQIDIGDAVITISVWT